MFIFKSTKALWELIKYLSHIHKWRYSYQKMQRHCPKCDDRQFRVWCDHGIKSQWFKSFEKGRKLWK